MISHNTSNTPNTNIITSSNINTIISSYDDITLSKLFNISSSILYSINNINYNDIIYPFNYLLFYQNEYYKTKDIKYLHKIISFIIEDNKGTTNSIDDISDNRMHIGDNNINNITNTTNITTTNNINNINNTNNITNSNININKILNRFPKVMKRILNNYYFNYSKEYSTHTAIKLLIELNKILNIKLTITNYIVTLYLEINNYKMADNYLIVNEPLFKDLIKYNSDISDNMSNITDNRNKRIINNKTKNIT
ncbi:hypothetical protein SLOPH_1105, partial [Spraguea lophii 42_110]